MHRQLHKRFLTLGALAILIPGAVSAQLREIVSKNVSASTSGAALELGFEDRATFEIRFDRGTVYIDDEEIGSYESGDPLDVSWRRLLGDAMALEDGALGTALAAWTAPTDLSPSSLERVARQVDGAIDDALRDGDAAVESEAGEITVSVGDESNLVRALLRSLTRMGVMEGALSGLDDDFRIHVDEDVTIPEGTISEGTLVVLNGTLRVEGEVRGDVVVVGGALDIRDSGVIRGEARIADARVLRNNGDVEGGVIDVLENESDREAEIRNRIRDEVRDEVRSDLRHELRNVTRMEDDSFSLMAPFRPVIRGVGGVMEKLILVFVLGLMGAGFLAFAGENLDTISETARRAPGRAAMVGFAGSFMLIPVWVLGAVALAVSIIGIPVAIAWLPLFPVAAALAGLLGYVAVARNAGEWLADSSWPLTGWIRKSNPIMTLVGGLLGLSVAFIAGNVVSIAPFLGVFSTLLFLIGSLITLFAVQIGFGAVLLTRGGRRREYPSSYDADAAWQAAMDFEGGVADDA